MVQLRKRKRRVRKNLYVNSEKEDKTELSRGKERRKMERWNGGRD